MRKYGKIWEDIPETQKYENAEKPCNIGHLRRNTKQIRSYKNMIKVLFICHGSILRSLEKACYINDFHRSNGAYYTTITPFVEELWCDNPKLHILNKMKRTYPRCRICPLHFYLRFFLPFPCCNCGRAFPRWLIGLFKYLDSLSISISETNCSLESLS